jgi:uncharacterized membrane protein YgdD (TMEM256/DUF423 family)
LLKQRYQLIGFGWSALLVGITVIMGAVGSHIVAGQYPENFSSYQLAVHYAELHSIAMCLLFMVGHRLSRSVFLIVLGSFLLGLSGFSGILVLKTFGLINPPPFAIPAGGLAFISGWMLWGVSMVLAGWRS